MPSPNPSAALPVSPDHATERLTALWALSEVALAGSLHALRLPGTGLLGGGVAVLLIGLLARYGGPKAILRALLIVLLIKLIGSPQASVGAYVAVAFQGITGFALFATLPGFRLAALMLGVLALVESAGQRVLVTTLIFGEPLWQTVDAFGQYVQESLGTAAGPRLSGWLIVGYLLFHGTVGGWLGYLAGRLPAALEREWAAAEVLPMPLTEETATATHRPPGRPWWQRRSFRVVLGVLVTFLVASWLLPKTYTKGLPGVGLLFFRAVTGLLLWYAVLSPLLLNALRGVMQSQQNRYAADTQRVLSQLPGLRRLAATVWQSTADRRGLTRLQQFTVRLLAAWLKVKPT